MSALLREYEQAKKNIKPVEVQEAEAKARVQADKNYARQAAYNIYLEKFANDPNKYQNAEKAVLGAELTQFGTVTLGVDAEQAFEDNRKAEGYIYGGLAFLSGLGLGVAAKPIAKGTKKFFNMFRGAPKPAIPTSVKSEAFDLLNYNMPEEAFKIDDVFKGAEADPRQLKKQDAKGNFLYPEVVTDKSARLGSLDIYRDELKDKAKPFTSKYATEVGVKETSEVNPDVETLSKFYSGAIEAIDNMSEKSLSKNMIKIIKEGNETFIKPSQLENYFRPLVAKGLIRDADYKYIVNEILENDPRVYASYSLDDTLKPDDTLIPLPFTKEDPLVDITEGMPRIMGGIDGATHRNLGLNIDPQNKTTSFLDAIAFDLYQQNKFDVPANRKVFDAQGNNQFENFGSDLKLKNIRNYFETVVDTPQATMGQLLPLFSNRFLMSKGVIPQGQTGLEDIGAYTNVAKFIRENPRYSNTQSSPISFENLLQDMSSPTSLQPRKFLVDLDYLRYLTKTVYGIKPEDNDYLLDKNLLKVDFENTVETVNVVEGKTYTQPGGAGRRYNRDDVFNHPTHESPELTFGRASPSFSSANPNRIAEVTDKTTGQYVDMAIFDSKDMQVIAKAMVEDLFMRLDNSIVQEILKTDKHSHNSREFMRAIRKIDEQDILEAEKLPQDHSLSGILDGPTRDLDGVYTYVNGTHKILDPINSSGKDVRMGGGRVVKSGGVLIDEKFNETLDRFRDILRIKILSRRMQVGQYADFNKQKVKEKEKLINLDKFKQIAKTELESGEGAYTINFDDRANRTQFEQRQDIMYPSIDLEGFPQIESSKRAGSDLRQYFVSVNAKNLSPLVSDANNIHNSTEGTLGYVRMSKRNGAEGNILIKKALNRKDVIVDGYDDREAFNFLVKEYKLSPENIRQGFQPSVRSTEDLNKETPYEMPNGEPVSRDQVVDLIRREEDGLFQKSATQDQREIIDSYLDSLKILDEDFLLVEEIQSDVHNRHVRKSIQKGGVEQPVLTHDDYTEKLIQSAIVFAKKKGVNKIVIPNPNKIRQARGGTEEFVPNPQKPGEMMKKYTGGMSEDVVQGVYVKGVKKATNKLKKIFGDNIGISSVNLQHTNKVGQDFVEGMYRGTFQSDPNAIFDRLPLEQQEATVIDITNLDFDPDTEYFKYNEGGYVGNVDSQMSELLN